MKKFVSIFLTMVIMMLPVFSAGAYKTETGAKSFSQAIETLIPAEETEEGEILEDDSADDIENTDDENVGSDETVTPELRLEKWLTKMRSRNEWSILVEGKYGPEAEMFIKNGKLALLIYNNGTVIEKVLYDGDKAIACSPKFPYYYYELDVDVEDSVAETADFALQDLEGMEFVKSYEFSGFYVEEYEHAKYGHTAVYFDGEEVAYVNYAETNEIATFSYEVKDKDVKLPFFAINLTPLINYFISIYSFFLNLYMGIIFGALFG